MQAEDAKKIGEKFISLATNRQNLNTDLGELRKTAEYYKNAIELFGLIQKLPLGLTQITHNKYYLIQVYAMPKSIGSDNPLIAQDSVSSRMEAALCH